MVDDLRSRRVDQQHPGFIRTNSSGPDRAVGLRSERNTDLDDIGRRHQLTELEQLEPGVARRPAPVRNAHAEPRPDLGNPPSDRTETDNGETFATKLDTL